MKIHPMSPHPHFFRRFSQGFLFAAQVFQFPPHCIPVSLSEMTEDSLQFPSMKIMDEILFEDEHEPQ